MSRFTKAKVLIDTYIVYFHLEMKFCISNHMDTYMANWLMPLINSKLTPSTPVCLMAVFPKDVNGGYRTMALPVRDRASCLFNDLCHKDVTLVGLGTSAVRGIKGPQVSPYVLVCSAGYGHL